MKNINKFIPKNMLLERKIIRYIAYSILILAVLISLWLTLSEKKKIISLETQNVIFTSKNIANKYNTLFEDLSKTASALNNAITKRITKAENPPPSLFDAKEIKRASDGSIRTDDINSGAFLAKSSKLNDTLLRYFFFSERVFELLGPVAKTHFSNCYFISKENFIRITPKEWALQIDADHNFENDIFYKIAIPENNPQKSAKWTPLYYDSILKKWMTSIIIPVYNKDEFIGVTGNDVFLDTIFKDIMELKVEAGTYHAVLFDSAGNLLVHQEHKDKILKKRAEMNSLFNINDLNDPLLSEIITQTIHRDACSDKISIIKEHSGTYYYSSHKIPAMDWYLCVYVPKAEILKNFHTFIIEILCISIILGLIIIFILRLYLKKLVLKRISTLGNAISKISSGDLDSQIEIKNNDEIGILESGFNDMQHSIENQFQELAKHREHLEELVKERTAELTEKNIKLEHFNELFVDREFRIKELRDELKERQ